MSTTEQAGHTPGAIRVARLIYEMHSTAARLSGANVTGDKYESNIELLAQLIDRETHSAELLEALTDVCLAAAVYNQDHAPDCNCQLCASFKKAAAAKRKAEGQS